jgi:hypothetical protein
MKRQSKDFNSDVLFKMSKKIAQLTKVIYYLHSKQDEHAFEIQQYQENYEYEISRVSFKGPLSSR